MDAKTYANAAAHYELKIEVERDIWLNGFSLEQRVRLGLQQEWLERTFPKFRKRMELT
jgi:hypothetical protein